MNWESFVMGNFSRFFLKVSFTKNLKNFQDSTASRDVLLGDKWRRHAYFSNQYTINCRKTKSMTNFFPFACFPPPSFHIKVVALNTLMRRHSWTQQILAMALWLFFAGFSSWKIFTQNQKWRREKKWGKKIFRSEIFTTFSAFFVLNLVKSNRHIFY